MMIIIALLISVSDHIENDDCNTLMTSSKLVWKAHSFVEKCFMKCICKNENRYRGPRMPYLPHFRQNVIELNTECTR